MESYHHRRRHRKDDGGDHLENGTMGEIHEEGRTIEFWRDENDQEIALGDYFIEEDVILSGEPFGQGEPDEKEAEGFTGNAGCTMDYWYRRAAIVPWAREDEEEILCRYNFHGACQALAGLASTKETGPGSPFHRLGCALIRQLPPNLPPAYRFSHYRSAAGGPLALILEALAKARAHTLLEELLPVVPDHAWTSCDAALWKKLHKAFGPAAFAVIYGRMSDAGAEPWRHLLFPILEALLAAKDGQPQARDLAARLAGLKPKPPRLAQWEKPPEPPVPGDAEEVRILLDASHLLDGATDRTAAMAFLLADRSLDYVRQVLAPVLIHRRPEPPSRGSLAPEAVAFAKELLAAELVRPLMPYPDWTRPCPVPDSPPPMAKWGLHHPGAKARDATRELVTFMADPGRKACDFRYPQDIRNMLERFIKDHALDLDCATIRKGTPHTLACTKNDKSYHRALARREADVKLSEQLAKV